MVRYGIQTSRGSLNAKVVYHATNGYARRLVSELRDPIDGIWGFKIHQMALRPSQMSTDVADDMHPGALFDCGSHWLIQRPREPSEKERPNVFIYGYSGGTTFEQWDDSDSQPAEPATRAQMFKLLREKLPSHYPNDIRPEDVEHEWNGICALTHRGNIISGKVSADRPGEFLCVDGNGEGMTRCFLASTVVSDAMVAFLQGKSYNAPDWFPRAFMRNIS